MVALLGLSERITEADLWLFPVEKKIFGWE
jgi:hypothetical protein